MTKDEMMKAAHEYRLSLCRCDYNKCDIEDAFEAGCLEGVKDIKAKLISRACRWIENHVEPEDGEGDAMIEDFRKAMEEQV